MKEPNAAPPPPEERWQNLARQEEQARRRRNLILTGAGAAGVGVIGLGALSMCGGPTTAPNDGKTAMDDVVQPYSPSPGPNEAPSNWQQINASGITFSLPATAVGPSPHPDWGLYTMSYDVPSSDQAGWHRVMISAADASTTAAGLRQTTDLANSGLIEGYAEITRVRWQLESQSVVERVAFVWGSEGAFYGWTWIIASSSAAGVVTLLGSVLDDGLRNGIEDTLAMTRRTR